MAEYDIVLRHKEDKFIAAIRDLHLVASGNDVASAVCALEKKKTALEEELRLLGTGDILPASTGAQQNSQLRIQMHALTQFALRWVIASVIVTAILVAMGGVAVRLALKPARSLLTAEYAIYKIEKELHRFSTMAGNMPAVRYDAALKNWIILTERARPFLDQLACSPGKSNTSK